MSEAAAKAFIAKMKSDEASRARVMAEEDIEARMAVIGAEGPGQRQLPWLGC